MTSFNCTLGPRALRNVDKIVWMEFLNEHQKGTIFLVYSINTLSVIHFCARQRNFAHLPENRFSQLEHTSWLPMTWQYPGLLCSHDKQIRFEKKDRKTWAFRRRTLFFLLITRFIYIRALIGRQIRHKNTSSKTSVVGTVNLWRTRAWRKKYIKFRRKEIEVRSSLLRPFRQFSPGESKSKISLSFCRFFSFTFLRWSIKSNCIFYFQFLAENPLVPTLRTLPQWNSLTNSSYSCGRTSRFENANT